MLNRLQPILTTVATPLAVLASGAMISAAIIVTGHHTQPPQKIHGQLGGTPSQAGISIPSAIEHGGAGIAPQPGHHGGLDTHPPQSAP